MELRHLRVFVAVADESHFSRAAIRLHLTQPAVSGHIRQLEDELGVRLLRRSTHHVALTDAGAAFLQDARRIILRADEATTRVRSWRNGNSLRLRVGYVDDGFPRALPIALRRMTSAAGAPHVQLTTSDPEGLIAQIRDENLDVAIVPLPASVGGLHVETFAREDAVVAVTLGLLDRHEEEIPLEIVARGKALAPPRRTNPGFYDAVLAAFRTAGLPSPVHEVDGVSIEQLLLRVAAGAGMAIVPRSVSDRFRIAGIGFRHLAHSSPIGCELAAVYADSAPRDPLEVFLGALKRSNAPAALASMLAVA